jgi:ferrochelatase
MSDFSSPQGFAHGELPRIGVLLTNLGTPDAPDARSLRRYLREFLLDPRVIELPRLLWWLILHLFILTRRPARSAALYRRVWTAEGSPLLSLSRRQAAGVAQILAREVAAPVSVALGMRYGKPSIAAALAELAHEGCRRILVLPLYPQYAAATTGSTFDAVAAALTRQRWVPELRFVSGYADDPGYIEALAASIREVWQKESEPDRLLFSFHGIPERYFRAGDPYYCFCQKTARRVVEHLGWPAERAIVSFQSRFGKEEWLKPYTDETLRRLAEEGVRSLDVICPGFAADCLETIDEIDRENREVFLHAGGRSFRYIPALNDRPDHLRALASLIHRQLGGWDDRWDAGEAAAQAEGARRRAEEMALRPPSAGTVLL